MLHLPSAERASIAPQAQPSECALVRLAEQFRLTNQAYNEADARNDEIDRKLLNEELDKIAERASHFTPLSIEGAAFMVMLAHDTNGTVEEGASEAIKQKASARQDRYHYRLLEFLGGGRLFPEVCEYLMDVALDPALDKRPAAGVEVRLTSAIPISPGGE
ncbi:hypothetical protein [Bradyrhizobium lupini]|uniref:hypothetical protein n=1 Tax=Rhizobium lupini TaxID=136996 RepID=UPI0034C5F9BC